MADVKLGMNPKKYRGETAPVTARLTVNLIKKIDSIADKTGRTRNDIIQKCMEFAVENLEITKK